MNNNLTGENPRGLNQSLKELAENLKLIGEKINFTNNVNKILTKLENFALKSSVDFSENQGWKQKIKEEINKINTLFSNYLKFLKSLSKNAIRDGEMEEVDKMFKNFTTQIKTFNL